MNVEIGAEAAQFPEKEYINGIAVTVYILFHKLYQGKQVTRMSSLIWERLKTFSAPAAAAGHSQDSQQPEA